jgi:hypothetical protein
MTPVWYRQTCRGGYGFQRDVPAVEDYRTGQRVSVLVVSAAGGQLRRIAVHPRNIRPRVLRDSGELIDQLVAQPREDAR